MLIFEASLHCNERSWRTIPPGTVAIGEHWAHLYPCSTVIKETKKSRWGAVELSPYLVIRLPVFAIKAAVQLVSPCPRVKTRISLGRYGRDSSHIAQVHLQPLALPVICCPAYAAVQPGVGCSTVLGATGSKGGFGQETVLEPQCWAAIYRAATNMVRDNFKQQNIVRQSILD